MPIAIRFPSTSRPSSLRRGDGREEFVSGDRFQFGQSHRGGGNRAAGMNGRRSRM
jgi:hypothetical protein